MCCGFVCVCICVVFFFKQKTAYDMRISDWSSDVCSSDLALTVGALGSLTFAVMARTRLIYRFRDPAAQRWIQGVALLISLAALARVLPAVLSQPHQIGRASCRESVCQYV